KDWLSSFSELVKTLRDKAIQEIKATTCGIYITFSDGLSFRMMGNQIRFGSNDRKVEGQSIAIRCEKNLVAESCSREYLTNLVVNQRVTSAGDWGDRFEFGLTDDLDRKSVV